MSRPQALLKVAQYLSIFVKTKNLTHVLRTRFSMGYTSMMQTKPVSFYCLGNYNSMTKK